MKLILPQSPKGTSPAKTLIPDFWPPEIWKNKFLWDNLDTDKVKHFMLNVDGNRWEGQEALIFMNL